MKQYRDLLTNIRDNGTVRMDRTGTGTTAIFGTHMRFKLSEGLPVLTLRKLHLRSIIHELLWFIAGDTTNRTLIDNDVHIWDEWGLKRSDTVKPANERDQLRKDKPITGKDSRYEYSTANTPGDLGPVYGSQWRHWSTGSDRWIDVAPRTGEVAGPVELPSYITQIDTSKLLDTNYPRHWDNCGNPFHVLGEVEDEPGKREIMIRFDRSGAHKRISPRSLLAGEISDPYSAKIYERGCIGVVSNALTTPLYAVWSRMMSRCYDGKNPMYRHEGKKGFYVSPRWLCFENFFRDVKKLPNYEVWTREPDIYDISPLYYGSKCYGPSTAVFLSHEDIVRYSSRQTFRVTNPKGIVSYYMGMTDLAKGLQVKIKDLTAHLEGGVPINKLTQYVINEILFEEGSPVMRRRLYIDQLAEVIAGLKKKPFSRRHIVTGWNPAVVADESISPQANVAVGNMALATCHCFFQFFCRELSYQERLKLVPDRYNFIAEVTDEFIHAKLDEDNVPKYALSCQLYQR